MKNGIVNDPERACNWTDTNRARTDGGNDESDTERNGGRAP